MITSVWKFKRLRRDPAGPGSAPQVSWGEACSVHIYLDADHPGWPTPRRPPSGHGSTGQNIAACRVPTIVLPAPPTRPARFGGPARAARPPPGRSRPPVPPRPAPAASRDRHTVTSQTVSAGCDDERGAISPLNPTLTARTCNQLQHSITRPHNCSTTSSTLPFAQLDCTHFSSFNAFSFILKR